MKKIKYSRLFVLGVLIYILFQGLTILLGLTTSVSTLTNKEYTIKLKTKGLVIRDEYLIKSDMGGTLCLGVDENEKVNKCEKVATVYNDYIDKSITDEIYNLNKEIKNLETNSNSLQQSMLSVKKEQLKILQMKLKNNSTDYYSNMPGIISYKYDNNENKYSVNNLANLTKEDIENAKNDYIPTSKDNHRIKPDDIIARAINNNEIYVAFVIKDNKLFNKGDSVKIKIGKQLMNGEIYKIYKKQGYFVTVVKITQQNIAIYDTRQVEFDIIYKQIEAIKIQRKSVVDKNNKKGVYIVNEENNKPEFVELKGISFEDEDSVYIDFRKNEINGVNTIKLHDRIILKPNFINTKIKKFN